MSTPSSDVADGEEILSALSSLGWLRYASRLGAAGLLEDSEFCGSLDQLATLAKATLAYQSATQPAEPSFGEPPPHRRSSAPNIMSGALGGQPAPPWPARHHATAAVCCKNSAAAVEAHPPRGRCKRP